MARRNQPADETIPALLTEIGEILEWDERRRTQLYGPDARDIYTFFKGEAPPDEYTVTDVRRWLVEVAYLLTHDDLLTAPHDELARYHEYDQAVMPRKHVRLLRDAVRDVAHDRVQAIEHALDPHQEPEWMDGQC